VLGLKVGESIELEKPFGATEAWTVTEIKSKYLHIFHVILNDFERRFPNHGGMWRFSVKDGDITPVLDLIRRKGEADREIAKSYTSTAVPLAFVARIMGGRPAEFAQFLRNIGMEVLTCRGELEERDAAIALAVSYRGKGVVLDEFTAWVAADMGILDILKSWFGRVLIPQAVIEAIDALIEKERDNIGRQMMTVGWRDGQYVRHESTDEFVHQQIADLEKLKSEIVGSCEINAVVLPDSIGEFTTNVLKLIGAHALDPIYLAMSEVVPLVSDDMHYRQVAAAVGLSEALWLQPVLIAALRAGVAERARVYRAYVQLAARKHRHVTLDPAALRGVFDLSGDKLAEFDAVTEYIGSPDADMVAHVKVTAALLIDLWGVNDLDLKSQAATGLIISKLIRFRQDSWAKWLALLIAVIRGNRPLLAYIGAWLTGHFLPLAPVNDASQRWTRAQQRDRSSETQRRRRRRRKR
jgi:predicted nucleic acid-binding protein